MEDFHAHHKVIKHSGRHVDAQICQVFVIKGDFKYDRHSNECLTYATRDFCLAAYGCMLQVCTLHTNDNLPRGAAQRLAGGNLKRPRGRFGRLYILCPSMGHTDPYHVPF